MKKVFLLAFLSLIVVAGAFAQNIGRIEQNGRDFLVFNEAGVRMASQNIGRGNHNLVGWGRDFFIVQYQNTLQSHDARGRRIGRWNSRAINPITLVRIANERIYVYTTREVGGNVRLARLDRQLRSVTN